MGTRRCRGPGGGGCLEDGESAHDPHRHRSPPWTRRSASGGSPQPGLSPRRWAGYAVAPLRTVPRCRSIAAPVFGSRVVRPVVVVVAEIPRLARVDRLAAASAERPARIHPGGHALPLSLVGASVAASGGVAMAAAGHDPSPHPGASTRWPLHHWTAATMFRPRVGRVVARLVFVPAGIPRFARLNRLATANADPCPLWGGFGRGGIHAAASCGSGGAGSSSRMSSERCRQTRYGWISSRRLPVARCRLTAIRMKSRSVLSASAK
jgi:hypothetical protein